MELQLHQNNFFKLLSFVCHRIDFYNSSSIKWNDTKNQPELQPLKKLKWLRARFIYSFIYCSIGFYSVTKNWSTSDTFVKTYGAFGLSSYLWAFPSTYMLYYHGHDVTNLLKSMIQFEKRELDKSKKECKDLFHMKNVKIRKERILKLICRVMSVNNHCAFVFHSNAILNPCFPINTGYNFSEYCQDSLGLNAGNIPWDNPRELFVRIVMVSTGLYMWVCIISNLAGMAIILIVKGHCISSYINYFTRLVKSNSFTIQNIQENCMIFRQLQVMLAEFRRMYSKTVLAPAAVGVVMLQITMTYLWVDLVRKGSAEKFTVIVGIGIFLTLELAMFTMFLFGDLAKVYGASTISRNTFRDNKRAMLKKEFRQFAVSCPLLRIYLGEQNFVEPDTCLVFEDFVFNNLIGLLVI